jgi:hypothetical protein
MPQLALCPEWSGNNRRTQTMTKSRQSMMAAAIAGLIVLGTIGFASALPKQSASTAAPKGTVTTGTAGRYGAPGTVGPPPHHQPACTSVACKGYTPAPDSKL